MKLVQDLHLCFMCVKFKSATVEPLPTWGFAHKRLPSHPFHRSPVSLASLAHRWHVGMGNQHVTCQSAYTMIDQNPTLCNHSCFFLLPHQIICFSVYYFLSREEAGYTQYPVYQKNRNKQMPVIQRFKSRDKLETLNSCFEVGGILYYNLSHPQRIMPIVYKYKARK